MDHTGVGSRLGESPAAAVLLTPPGQGGITVILLTGPRSLAILETLFLSPKELRLASAPVGRLLYGTLCRESEVLDEVVVARVPGHPPGDWAFEINCHGGPLPARRILAALRERGAEEMPWARFVAGLRAAGVLDRIQSEASDLLPRALNLSAARMLLAQQQGTLSEAVRHAADLVERNARAAAALLQQTVDAARYGDRLVRPARVGVAGRPNVGKSSLMNAFLRHDRVIVHPEPGTTRDLIEEPCDICGVPVQLVDMAGIRDTRDPVEVQGVQRAHAALKDVDLVLMVFDGSQTWSPEDEALLSATAKSDRVIVVNKADLPAQISGERFAPLSAAVLRVSAETGQGLAELEATVADTLAGPQPDLAGPVPFTRRQERLLRTASAALTSRPPDSEKARAALADLLGEPPTR